MEILEYQWCLIECLQADQIYWMCLNLWTSQRTLPNIKFTRIKSSSCKTWVSKDGVPILFLYEFWKLSMFQRAFLSQFYGRRLHHTENTSVSKYRNDNSLPLARSQPYFCICTFFFGRHQSASDVNEYQGSFWRQWAAGAKCWQPHRRLWADFLENMASLTSRKPMDLHGLLQG
jgi:hypothetical protein